MNVSSQTLELAKQFQDSLARLTALIENRSAWVDGIEGCREGVVLLTHAQERLQAVAEDARKLESELASARAEIDRWSKMHSELSAVERSLRFECEEKRVALEQRAQGLVRARALVRDLTRELST